MCEEKTAEPSTAQAGKNSLSAAFVFPQPTGKYAVGTNLFYWTDLTRKDPETNKPRELVVQVWYPAEGKMGSLTAPYTYEGLADFKKDEADATKEKIDLIRTHAISDALPVSEKGTLYPLIVFGHGYGMSRGQYSFFCEEIASHGYIVAMVMHL